MVSVFEQFVRFGTDAYGLDRTLRLLRALVSLLISYPLFLNLLLAFLSLITSSSPVLTLSVLHGLRARLDLTRRLMRLFRFLEAFQSAWTAHQKLQQSQPKNAITEWLDISAHSFNGMYLLLEAVGLPDALAVEGLQVLGAERAGWLDVEAQRFWFLALVSGVCVAMLRVKETLRGPGIGQNGKREDVKVKVKGKEKADGPKNDMAETLKTSDPSTSTIDHDTFPSSHWTGQRLHLRCLVSARKAQRKAWRREMRTQTYPILRRLAADVLDLALPGAVVGWVSASQGAVAWCMLGSTWLTGLEVWERCGRELVEMERREG